MVRWWFVEHTVFTSCTKQTSRDTNISRKTHTHIAYCLPLRGRMEIMIASIASNARQWHRRRTRWWRRRWKRLTSHHIIFCTSRVRFFLFALVECIHCNCFKLENKVNILQKRTNHQHFFLLRPNSTMPNKVCEKCLRQSAVQLLIETIFSYFKCCTIWRWYTISINC